MASTSIREVTSSATLEEKKKLRKEFTSFDMIFYTLSALIGLDTLGAFSSNGEQALTWLIIAAMTFLLPYGLLTAEIGSTFTQEGSDSCQKALTIIWYPQLSVTVSKRHKHLLTGVFPAILPFMRTDVR